jgi:hypothetical protein
MINQFHSMVESLFHLKLVSIRKSRPTNRSSRLATLPFFNHTLLAKVMVSGSDLASPQSAKLKRWAAKKPSTI